VSRRLRRQVGYTLVETIVAITVGAIVIAAIFPIFLLLYRVETTWGAKQARVSGILAEDTLLRDLRAYDVDQLPVDQRPAGQLPVDRRHPLTLRASGGEPYFVEYSVDASARLIRTVRVEDTVLSSFAVAHGIQLFTADCSGDPATIRFTIEATGIGGTIVRLAPPLVITPRNPQRCPPP
jgi:type II secretory pathway pseudopilin PulG